MLRSVVQRFLYYLVKGLLVVLPVAGAVFLIIWLVATIDNALNITHYVEDEAGRPYYIPGMGIVMVILILVVVGFIFTTFVTTPIQHWLARLGRRIPIYNTLYSSIKDFTEAFVGDAKKFNEPVLVLVNETGLKKIGFLTQKDLGALSLHDQVMVYFPYSYSFAGQVVIVKKEHVEPLDMSPTDAMKLVVSGGVTNLD